MTAHQHYELRCDHAGCVARYNIGDSRADRTRASAARCGWVHGVVQPNIRNQGPKRSLDYCREHAADLPPDALTPTLPLHATNFGDGSDVAATFDGVSAIDGLVLLGGPPRKI